MANDNAERRRNDFLDTGIRLYQAAMEGNWQDAERILDENPNAIRLPVTESNDTALHIAILAQQTTFARNLLQRMNGEDLKIRNIYGCTALHAAAIHGTARIAELMLNENIDLLTIESSSGQIPLQEAAFSGNREMAWYLFRRTNFQSLDLNRRIDIFSKAISGDLYDIALQILNDDEDLAHGGTRQIALQEDESRQIALQLLAKKTSWIGAKSHLSVWEKFLNSSCNGICNKALMRASANQLVHQLWERVRRLPKNQFFTLLERHSSLLADAAELGNAEFLSILRKSYPEIANIIIRLDEEKEWSIFHIAISYRQEKVFHFIYEDIVTKKIFPSWFLEKKNNLLHLAALMPLGNQLNTISGVALQMQRESLWFKEIEKIVPPSYVKSKNLEGKTPYEVFVENHKDLRKDAEKWMNGTTKNCMIVATLISTVVFAAIFTIPGEYNGKQPTFLEDNWFSVFFISNAIALLSSSTSIFVFLSILTSRYKEEDFLKSLPTKLGFGFITLFVSIIGMVLAFSAACFLVYKTKTVTTPIVIIAVASVPISLFICLHYKLWFEILRTTYGFKFLFRSSKRWLF